MGAGISGCELDQIMIFSRSWNEQETHLLVLGVILGLLVDPTGVRPRRKPPAPAARASARWVCGKLGDMTGPDGPMPSPLRRELGA